MNKHTTARIGKRIHVVLTNGEKFIDKLKENKATFFVFEEKGRINKKDITSFSIAKAK